MIEVIKALGGLVVDELEPIALEGISDLVAAGGGEFERAMDSLGVPAIGDYGDAMAVQGAASIDYFVDVTGLSPIGVMSSFSLDWSMRSIDNVVENVADIIEDPSLDSIAGNLGDMVARYRDDAAKAMVGAASGVSDSINGALDNLPLVANGPIQVPGLPLSAFIVDKVVGDYRVPDFGEMLERHPRVLGALLNPVIGPLPPLNVRDRDARPERGGTLSRSRIADRLSPPPPEDRDPVQPPRGPGRVVDQGMDVEQAQRIASDLAVCKGDLDALVAAADHAVAQLTKAWNGRDAELFAQDYAGSRRQVEHAVQQLDSMVKDLTQQIAQQRATSAR